MAFRKFAGWEDLQNVGRLRGRKDKTDERHSGVRAGLKCFKMGHSDDFLGASRLGNRHTCIKMERLVPKVGSFSTPGT